MDDLMREKDGEDDATGGARYKHLYVRDDICPQWGLTACHK